MPDPREREKERKDNGWGDGDGERAPRIAEKVKFLAAPVGFERYESSGKGTPAIMIRYVCVAVLSRWDGKKWENDSNDYDSLIGHIIDKDYWLSGKMGDLCDMALAHGWEEPFDENDDDQLERIIQNGLGVIVITTKNDPYDGKDKWIAAFFNKPRAGTEEDPEWEAIIAKGVEGFNKYFAWREKNPRRKPGEEPKAAKGGGGGGGGNAGGSGRRKPGDGGGEGRGRSEGNEDRGGGAPDDDDIPF